MTGFKSLVAAMAALVLSVSASAQRTYVNIETANTQMVLGTDAKGQLLFLHYGAKVGNPEQFENWNSYRRTDYSTDALAYPAQGGRFFNEPALAVKYHDTDQNTELVYGSQSVSEPKSGVKRYEVLLKDVKTKLEVKLIYMAYVKEDVIVANTEITNGGCKAIALDRYASSAINLRAGKYLLSHFYGSWAREMQIDREMLTHGVKAIENKQGVRTTHNENPSFMLSLDTESFSENDGEVIAGALAWSGNYRLAFQMDETNQVSVLCGINPDAAAYPLKKHETFTTPEMVWTCSLKGAGQASRNLHDWARNHCCYSQAEICPTLLNSWEGAYFDFNAKTLTDMMDDAKDMGLEMFVLDDGWFGNKYPRNNSKQGLGDWDINHEKLPEGIGYLADYAHSKGLKFGIWIEPEMVSPKSELAEKHPEWVVGSKDRELTTTRSQWLLDLTNPKVQDFVFSIFDNTMQLAPGIDYIKWDCNRHVENFGSTYLDDQSKFYVDYIQGLYSVMRRIREKYPHVIVQSCSSGGGRVDFGALSLFDEVWTSDNTEGLSRVFIQYGTNMIYPACVTGSHVSAVPNHQSGNVTPMKFRFDIAAAGRLGMELQPKNMTEEEKTFARKAIESYKGYRDLVFGGDLYRLADPYDGQHYALMYVSKDRSRAVVFAYTIKYQARTQIFDLRLAGLDQDRRYKVTEQNVEKSCWWGSGKSFEGSFLMNHGLNPDMKKVYDSAVFLIEAE